MAILQTCPYHYVFNGIVSAHSQLTNLFPLLIRRYTSGTVNNRDEIHMQNTSKLESATHVLCDCEATAYLRFRRLGQFIMEPNDYYDAPINKILHFIRGIRSIQSESKGAAQ
jgi:hypothetical protein